ncbi:MAG: hypothetical protein JWM32_3118 [Verrucomicrobia bacterium]|nr:hypothetical protein [Verrucomicrobiota bacterium]
MHSRRLPIARDDARLSGAAIIWRRGGFRFRASTANRAQRSQPILRLYEQMVPPPPDLETLEALLAAVPEPLSADERDLFRVQAAILRASAKEYFAL